MKANAEYEKNMQAGWIECFKPHNKTLYRTLLGMSLQTFQQLTGANYFFYYGASVFQSVGIQDSFVTQIILGAVNFGCTFLGVYVMERVSFSVAFVMANKLMYIAVWTTDTADRWRSMAELLALCFRCCWYRKGSYNRSRDWQTYVLSISIKFKRSHNVVQS